MLLCPHIRHQLTESSFRVEKCRSSPWNCLSSFAKWRVQKRLLFLTLSSDVYQRCLFLWSAISPRQTLRAPLALPIPSGITEAPYLLLFCFLSAPQLSGLSQILPECLCVLVNRACSHRRDSGAEHCAARVTLKSFWINPWSNPQRGRERLIKTFLNSVRYKRGEKPKPLWCDYKRFLCVTLPWAATLRYVKLLPQLFVSCVVFPPLACLQGCRYMLICPTDRPGEESQTRNIQFQGNLVDATVLRRLHNEWLFALDCLYGPYPINSLKNQTENSAYCKYRKCFSFSVFFFDFILQAKYVICNC